MRLKKINLKLSYSTDKDEYTHDGISLRKTYLVKYGSDFIAGQFEREWYGLNFTWYAAVICGVQLDHLVEEGASCWEIIP